MRIGVPPRVSTAMAAMSAGSLHEAEAAHDVHFRPVLDVRAAAVAVAIGERVNTCLSERL